MATHCAFYLKTTDIDLITEAIESFYDRKNYRITHSDGTNLPELYGKKFPVFAKEPTAAAVRKSSSYSIIDYNCFYVPHDLIHYLCKKFSSPAVNVIFQTCSESYCFHCFREGEVVREIGSADGELYENRGEYLPFESDPLGIDQSEEEDEEPWYSFGIESLEQYAGELGFPSIFDNPWDGSGKTVRIHKKNILEKLFGMK